MKRYVFYDETGRVVHTHAVVSAETGEPEPVAEDDLHAMVGRMVDPARTRCLLAEVSTASSRAVDWRVDEKAGRLEAVRITPVARRPRPRGDDPRS